MIVADLAKLDHDTRSRCCWSRSLLVMAATLALVFRGRPRLLPLRWRCSPPRSRSARCRSSGASLTMASIAVLPVLIGLAVDYAIQFQSRVGEALSARATGRTAAGPRARRSRARRGRRPDDRHRRRRERGRVLVLLLSPVPMVRGFGVLLVVGVALALLVRAHRRRGGARAGAAARRRAARAGRPRARAPRACRVAAALARCAASCCATTRSPAPCSRVALGAAVRRPARVLGVGLALAALGWGLDTQTKVETDITKLVPQNLSLAAGPARARARHGRGRRDRPDGLRPQPGEPRDVEWMSPYQARVLAALRLQRRRAAAGKARLCPAFSLPDLFGSAGRRGGQQAPKLTPGAVERAARRDPAVLLPGRDHARPARRDARLRHPPDAPRPAAAADRSDAREPAPARRRAAPSSSGCRCWPPSSGSAGRRPVAAPRHAAGRPARGRARAAGRVPRRPRAARSCRSRRSRSPRAGRRSCCSRCASR